SAPGAPRVVRLAHQGSAPHAPKPIIEPTIKPIRGTGKNIPPSIDEVQQYIQDKQYRIDIDCFMSHYESNGWKVGKNKMKNWQAAVRTWQARNNNDNNDIKSIGGR
ncbi:MAG: hypothetical protein V3U84_00255, partial [Thiotrichaceae bacterium]